MLRTPLRDGLRSAQMPLRHTSYLRSSVRMPLRYYSTNKNEMPKFRYFVLLTALGVGGSVLALKFVGNKRSRGEISASDYEKLKAQPAKRAFSEDEAFVVFVLGGPGSGKGTQCDKIVNNYNFVHLSAGDLLRAEQSRPGSQYGELIKSYIKSGQIVPQEITLGLLKNAMTEAKGRGYSHFLIDGFPRKMDQALSFEETIVPSRFTLFFECPEQIMLNRLLNRGLTSGRSDDNIDSIVKRFKTFVDDSMPVVEYFDNAGKVAKLRCDESIDEVYAKVQEALKKHGVVPRK